jgi:hypothetical protein
MSTTTWNPNEMCVIEAPCCRLERMESALWQLLTREFDVINSPEPGALKEWLDGLPIDSFREALLHTSCELQTTSPYYRAYIHNDAQPDVPRHPFMMRGSPQPPLQRAKIAPQQTEAPTRATNGCRFEQATGPRPPHPLGRSHTPFLTHLRSGGPYGGFIQQMPRHGCFNPSQPGVKYSRHFALWGRAATSMLNRNSRSSSAKSSAGVSHSSALCQW